MNWKKALSVISEHLIENGNNEPIYWSWCSWTTFSRLQRDAGYWTAPLPRTEDLSDIGVIDGGMWTQPFQFIDMAHLVVPKKFTYRKEFSGSIVLFESFQDIELISDIWNFAGIPNVLGDFAVEIKLY